MEPQVIAIIISSLALILLFVAYAAYLDRKRRDAIQALAQRWGFVYRRGPESFTEMGGESPVGKLLRGMSMKKENICVGRRGGVAVELFDLKTTTIVSTGKGMRRRTETEQAALVTLGKTVPGFTLAPENILTRIGEKLGMQDIDFPEDQEFSRRYVLKGEEAAVKKLFDQNVRHAFLALPTRIWVTGTGERILFKTDSRMGATELERFAEACIAAGKALESA